MTELLLILKFSQRGCLNPCCCDDCERHNTAKNYGRHNSENPRCQPAFKLAQLITGIDKHRTYAAYPATHVVGGFQLHHRSPDDDADTIEHSGYHQRKKREDKPFG